MSLTQSGSQIIGVYRTRVGDDRVLMEDHALVGATVGELIGFVVAWQGTNSLTSWAGRLVQLDKNTQQIHTVWHLVRESDDGIPPRRLEPWECFQTYSAVFTRIR